MAKQYIFSETDYNRLQTMLRAFEHGQFVPKHRRRNFTPTQKVFYRAIHNWAVDKGESTDRHGVYTCQRVSFIDGAWVVESETIIPVRNVFEDPVVTTWHFVFNYEASGWDYVIFIPCGIETTDDAIPAYPMGIGYVW